ncbi:MAG: hypothetical protein ABW022_22255 [Actinoplanes sp.]
MTPDEAVDAMAERLLAIDYLRHGDKAWSKAALVREYFRRAARWANAYDCDSKTPFFDIAACVDPAVRADQAVVDRVVKAVPRRTPNAMTRLAPFILHWAALRETPGVKLREDLEDPFFPLIVAFERDGGFHVEKGEINVEYLTLFMRDWRARAGDPPLKSFAADALDEIDRAGSMAQFGYVIGPDGEPQG